MRHLKNPNNMVWRVARDIEPAPFSALAEAVEREAIEQQIQPFWVHRAVIRLIKDGLIVLTPKGYMTRSRNEVRRSKGGQRCDTD